MPIPSIQPSLNAGELSPSLFGRVDLAKYKSGLSTCRNMFASYRGGVSSRAGTKFVGQSPQPASAFSTPPQLIPFQFNVTQGIVIEAGDNYFRFAIDGAYVLEASNPITGITQANPGVVTVANSWNEGDFVYLSGIGGMTQLNGQTFLVHTPSGSAIQLENTLTGAVIDTSSFSAYTGGGTAARIYSLITPYAAADLPLLKWAQSADVMTLTHPNYAPRDLARITDNLWTLKVTTFGTSLPAPTTSAAIASSSGTFYYQYCGTAVDGTTGQESIASGICTTTSVDIGTQAGTITVNIGAVTGASSYNFYRGPLGYNSAPNAGQLFGFVGTSLGPSFVDSNITPDFSVVPPTHQNPFATSSVLAISMSNYGNLYSSTASVSVSSATGSGFSGMPIVINGQITWVNIANGGQGYTSSNTVIFTDTTGGTASGSLIVGPATGTWPSVVAYFQQRRFYANTNNNPDTYYASQPGAFTNMDSSIPTIASDAIVGSPWSQQVNGIQWMINMPGGLVILTGNGAWQLSGAGSGLAVSAAVTPDSQIATPQAFNGVNPAIRPIVINYDILYVQARGSIVRDLSYNFFVNIYTGTDMTVLSDHLFDGHSIVRWDWSEEPNKLLWAVRDDGILLCLTYLKEQDVYAWTRHDTNGLFQSVCTVSEPPVNAPYFIVKRLIQTPGTPTWVYYLERMDNRLWETVDESWCVDCGLSYPQNSYFATLTCSSATGSPNLYNAQVLYGGANYSAETYAVITDPTGQGATLEISIVGGAVFAPTLYGNTEGYTDPTVTVIDPTGAGNGAMISISVINIAMVTSNGIPFTGQPGAGANGDVIRLGGGTLVVTQFISESALYVNVIKPITDIIQNDPYNTVVPQTAGAWTITDPVSTIYGLGFLEGMTVSILADGNIVAPQTVVDGSINIGVPASQILIGLGFTAQAQTMYLDMQSQATTQGQRKSLYSAVVRVEGTSTPFDVGANQPDASTQLGNANIPWTNMTQFTTPFGNQTPLQPFSLYTGDIYGDIQDALGLTNGQLAVQQTAPVPLNIVALIPETDFGDQPPGN